jgi:hypothetical protein
VAISNIALTVVSKCGSFEVKILCASTFDSILKRNVKINDLILKKQQFFSPESPKNLSCRD